MQKTFSIFYSRTIWTLVAIFIVGGGNAIVPVLPPVAQTIIVALLGILAGYFKLNPSQSYNQDSVKTN